jgi:peptide/nickel transport system substrate-binding protein
MIRRRPSAWALGLALLLAAACGRTRPDGASIDALIEQASAATDEAHRGEAYTRAQQLISEDVPYISLWYRTNVAIFQPDIRGVSLSPVADYTFLRQVYRETGAAGGH